MNLAECYRLLGLRSGASFAEIKASYRRLARQYHPDINPVDQTAKDKFIAINEAYKLLASLVQPVEKTADQSQEAGRQDIRPTWQQTPTKVTRKEKPNRQHTAVI